MFDLFKDLKKDSYIKYRKYIFRYIEKDILYYGIRPSLILFEKDDNDVDEINFIFDVKQKKDILLKMIEKYGHPDYHLGNTWEKTSQKEGIYCTFTFYTIQNEPYNINKNYPNFNFLWSSIDEFIVVCTEFSLTSGYEEEGFFVKYRKK